MRWIPAVVVLAIFSGGPLSGTEPSEETVGVTVVWLNHCASLSVDKEFLVRRVERAFLDMGVRMTWKEGAVAAATRTARVEVPVHLFCSKPEGFGLPSRAMGAALTKSGPSTLVFIPSIRHALRLDPDPNRLPTQRELRDVSFAVGRVIVHEIIHVVVPGYAHTEGGLMRENLNRALLVDGPTPLEPGFMERFRRALLDRSRDAASNP